MTPGTLEAPSRPSLVLWGLVSVVISVVGFWPTYIAPSVEGTYASVSTSMPLHVVFATLWLLLILAQPVLIWQKEVRLHRQVGVLGALVAAGVVVTGVIVQTEVMGSYAARDDVANAVHAPFFRLVTMLIFALGVGAALVLRRHPEWHGRLMMFATFCLLEAPMQRVGTNLLGLGDRSGLFAAAGHMLLVALFVAWDRRAAGRFEPATVWGAVLTVALVVGTAPIAFTGWWRDVAARLAGV